MNAAGLVLAKGCEALGIDWAPTPLATLSAPRGRAHPCVYRGFCVLGCSTNAKQSVLVTWLPRALAAGAEIRDLAMVGRVEVDAADRATGVHYHREGRWRFQRARNVVVAGYAIETPRLLLNSATDRHPEGLANSSGLVGKYLTVQANQAVWGTMEEEIRSLQGPALAGAHRALELLGPGQGLLRRLLLHEPGAAAGRSGPRRRPTATASGARRWSTRWSGTTTSPASRSWASSCRRSGTGSTLADEKDQYGLPIARVTYSWCDNDKRLADHALRFMSQALEAAGGREIWQQTDDTCHLNGTARMGDDPRTSVVDADCRSWDIRNLWICDGSVFPTVRRREPLAHHPGDRLPDRRPDQGRWPRGASCRGGRRGRTGACAWTCRGDGLPPSSTPSPRALRAAPGPCAPAPPASAGCPARRGGS